MPDPNMNSPCMQDFISGRHMELTSHQLKLWEALEAGDVVARGRQHGKPTMLREYSEHMLDLITRKHNCKRHHRCYCGSGKLNKNCCK